MLRFFIFTLGLSAFFFSCENEPAESMDNETEILFRSQLDTYAATIRSELSNFESDEIKRLAEQDFTKPENLERFLGRTQLNTKDFWEETEKLSQGISSLSYSKNQEELTEFLEEAFREVIFEGKLLARGIPCYEAYQDAMNAAALHAAACVMGFGGTPAAVAGCTIIYLAEEATASSNYDNCIHSTYGG